MVCVLSLVLGVLSHAALRDLLPTPRFSLLWLRCRGAVGRESSFVFLFPSTASRFSQHFPVSARRAILCPPIMEAPAFTLSSCVPWGSLSSSLFFSCGPFVCPCQYHTVFVLRALTCVLISARTSVPSSRYVFKDWSIHGSLFFCFNFRVSWLNFF